jgi:DNA-directed RNA polymerase specialized sigma24 family protein
MSAIRDRLPRGGEGGATRGQQPLQSRDAEELAARFTVHARDLYGYACVLTGADRPLAGDLVQAAFQAAAAVWCTLRDLPARFAGWLRTRRSGPHANVTHANGTPTNGFHANGVSPNGGTCRPRRTGANAPPGSYGDPMSALYEEHYASLVRLAALLVHDTAAAEEIVQDSFVAVAAAWRRRGNLACPLDFLRQSVVERSRSGRYRSPTASGCANGSAPLLAALGALPARQREVLVMRYYANLSEEQAADAIGISPAAVRRHATRASTALRTLLDAS